MKTEFGIVLPKIYKRGNDICHMQFNLTVQCSDKNVEDVGIDNVSSSGPGPRAVPHLQSPLRC